MAHPLSAEARETVPLTIRVSARVLDGLTAMARKAGRTPALQAQLLFDAAYSARCKPTGDEDLDQAVAAIDASGGALVPAQLEPKVREALAKPSVMQGEPFRPERIFGAGEPALPVTVAQVFEAAPAKLEIVQSAARSVIIPVEEETYAELDPFPWPDPPPAKPEPPSAAVADAARQDPSPAMDDAVAADTTPDLVVTSGGDEARAEGASDPHRDGSDASAPLSPQDLPPAPAELSAAQAKLIRQLKSIGNTTAEISDILGVPASQVRAVLGQGKRR